MAYSDWTGMDSVDDIVTAASTNTNGLFGIAVWGTSYVVLWIVMTMVSTRMGSDEPAKEGFMTSSVMMIFITILMSVLEWVDETFVVVPIILSVVGIIISTRRG